MDTANQSLATLGKPAPAFDATDLDGKPIRLSDFKGHPVLINFWASWCGPCRAEEPGLVRIADEYRARGLRVIGVTVRDNLAQARIHRDEFHMDFPSVFDQAARLAYAYEVDAPPSSVLIDSNGIVRFKITGALSEEGFRQAIEDKVKSSLTAG